MDQPIRILQCVTIMNRNGLENRLSELSGRVGAPLTVVHPSQNSGRAAFPHPALCETNRSHYHSYILTYIRGLTSG